MRLENLRESYLHDLSIYGEEAWIAKHRGYARAEAREHGTPAPTPGWSRLLAGDPLNRRRSLKRLSFALPCRPQLRFLYQYILRGGFLDGGPGLHYCRLLCRYEGFISHEIAKLKRPAPPDNP